MYYFTKDGEAVISLDFQMKPRFVYANAEVLADAGKCALTHGPLVYCMEGCDNEHHLRNITVDTNSAFELGFNEELGVPTISVDAYARKSVGELYSFSRGVMVETKAKFIPYYAFANRGITEMQVWTQYK